MAVHGIVFAVQTPRQQSVLLQLRPQSQLQGQHFVKVDPLFYTFGAVAAGASSVQVLSYLEGFERTLQSVPSVYAVVLVPASIEDDVVEDTGQYTPPQPALKLNITRASYHVHTANTLMQRGREGGGRWGCPWVPGGGAWHSGWAETVGCRARDWAQLGGVQSCGRVAVRAVRCLPVVRSRA